MQQALCLLCLNEYPLLHQAPQMSGLLAGTEVGLQASMLHSACLRVEDVVPEYLQVGCA